MDNDEENEIITIHGGFQRASVYQQNANGTYSNFRLFQTPYASHYAPEGLAIGDINNDNGKDIIEDTGSGLVVLYNTATLTTQNFNEDDNTIRLFPNPAADFVNVDFGNRQFNNATVSLYDFTGKLLLREIYVNATNNKPLNIANLSLGLYLLVVTDGSSAIAVRKVIKK